MFLPPPSPGCFLFLFVVFLYTLLLINFTTILLSFLFKKRKYLSACLKKNFICIESSTPQRKTGSLCAAIENAMSGDLTVYDHKKGKLHRNNRMHEQGLALHDPKVHYHSGFTVCNAPTNCTVSNHSKVQVRAPKPYKVPLHGRNAKGASVKADRDIVKPSSRDWQPFPLANGFSLGSAHSLAREADKRPRTSPDQKALAPFCRTEGRTRRPAPLQ